MNFLAHIYLSGSDKDLMIGNFIADRVRPIKESQFADQIVKGIHLHRYIDDYTDHHPLVKEAQTLLFAEHHKYALVLTDIFFDHFLARDWSKWHDQNLEDYTLDFYQLLEDNQSILPTQIQFMLPYMKKGNWLFNYQYVDGINRVLQGMSRRANFENKMNLAVKDLEKNYQRFEEIFNAFFPDLKKHCLSFLAR